MGRSKIERVAMPPAERRDVVIEIVWTAKVVDEDMMREVDVVCGVYIVCVAGIG